MLRPFLFLVRLGELTRVKYSRTCDVDKCAEGAVVL
jgi:hypothetical protein